MNSQIITIVLKNKKSYTFIKCFLLEKIKNKILVKFENETEMKLNFRMNKKTHEKMIKHLIKNNFEFKNKPSETEPSETNQLNQINNNLDLIIEL